MNSALKMMISALKMMNSAVPRGHVSTQWQTLPQPGIKHTPESHCGECCPGISPDRLLRCVQAVAMAPAAQWVRFHYRNPDQES